MQCSVVHFSTRRWLSPSRNTLERNRLALEAELSGDYGLALGMYKKLLVRHDTRYENETEESSSSQDNQGVMPATSAFAASFVAIHTS